MNFVIRRLTFSPNGPTYGVFLKDDVPQCVTLELPYKDNQENISCILPGTYNFTLIDPTEKFPYPHYAIDGVEGRTNVRMHVGNTIADTEGCVLAGHAFFPGGILESMDAMKFLPKVLPKSFPVTILNP